MSYTVSAASGLSLTLNETDVVKSVLQNVYIIMLTKVGNVPMHRDLGMQMKWLDKPANVVPTLMVADLKESIEKFEPRAKFVQVTFEQDESDPGRYMPTVEVEIDGA